MIDLPSKGWIVVDIETEGEPWDGRLLGVGVADPMDPDVFAAYLPEPSDWLLKVLADPEVGTVEHTLFDARWLRLAGYDIQGPIADTRKMAWNVDENTPLDLEFLARKYCNIAMDKRIVSGGKKFRCDDGTLVPLGDAPWDQMEAYNLGDLRATSELFNKLLPLQPKYWKDQLKLTSVLLEMEVTGLPIDTDQLEVLREEYTARREELREDLVADLPPAFNLNSGDQVAAYLFLPEFDLPARVRKGEVDPDTTDFEVIKEGRLYVHGQYHVKGLGLKPTKWTDSEARPATDAKTLAVKHGDNPWVQEYLQYQKYDKVVNTYLEGMPRYVHDGRLYGRFNQAGTVTGRLSSSNPNFQNFPRRGETGDAVRRLFRGKLVVADFSQLEPRIMAHYSMDPELLRVYHEGLDIYKQLASAIFDEAYDDVLADQREISKTLVLGMGYGAKSRTIAESLSVAGFMTSQSTAARYLKKMEQTYSRFFEWREEIIRDARINGFIETIGGRKRHLDFHFTDEWRVERQAVNSKIQGSAADIVDGTMLGVAALPSLKLLAQVHDELVIEYLIDPKLSQIQQCGEKGHGFTLRVPLVFEPKVVESWGDK